MTAVTVMVPAHEVRIGDLIETPFGEVGEVTNVRVSRHQRDHILITLGQKTTCIVYREHRVQVTLEDGGATPTQGGNT